jgi:uncharacterized protein (TIRG00374 family)
MPNLRRRLISGLLFGFLVILALALLADVRQVGSRLASFSWGLLPLILACTLFNYILRFIKWQYYLNLIGVRGLAWTESARLFVAGFPLAVTPGKVGEALKAVWVNQKTGVSVARAVPVVVAERISDGLAVLFLSTAGVIAYPAYWPAFAVVLTLLLGAVLLSQVRPLALALLSLAERLPVIRRVAHHLLSFYEGTYALFRPKAVLAAVMLGTAAWLGEGIGMYWVLRGLGLPGGWESLSLAVFVLSFSTVVGAVSALPGGLGAAEASIAGMLGLLMALPAETAAAATLLIRFCTLWFGVTLGLMVWAFSRDLLTPVGQPAAALDTQAPDR